MGQKKWALYNVKERCSISTLKYINTLEWDSSCVGHAHTKEPTYQTRQTNIVMNYWVSGKW